MIKIIGRAVSLMACILAALAIPQNVWATGSTEELLTGEIIGTMYSYDYTTGQSSSTVNTKANAFDGNPSTFLQPADKACPG